jgi:hypothetical protein
MDSRFLGAVDQDRCDDHDDHIKVVSLSFDYASPIAHVLRDVNFSSSQTPLASAPASR